MTRLTRKLLLSILTVVLSVGALGTTTFAWFTLTNTATVEQFSAQIVSDTGIEISLDGENWYNALSPAMIQAYITEKYGAFRFNHVTSQNGVTFQTLGTSSLTPASTGSFLALKIYFRSESVEQLAWTAVSLTGTPVNWRPDVTFTGKDSAGASVTLDNTMTTYQVNPASAMRIGVVSPEDNATAAQRVYERPEGTYLGTYNTVLGTGGDLSNGGIGDPGAMNYYYAKSGGQSLPYGLGSWDGEPLEWTATPVTVVETVSTLPLDATSVVMQFAATTNGEIYYAADDITINYGQARGGYIIVNIWFEGYDAEAYNSLLGLPVNISLEFKGYPFE